MKDYIDKINREVESSSKAQESAWAIVAHHSQIIVNTIYHVFLFYNTLLAIFHDLIEHFMIVRFEVAHLIT